MSDVLQLKCISHTYLSGPPWAQRAFRAISDVSFSIAAGETLGLVGQSGSGKSTIAKICLGLMHSTEGQAELDGMPVYGIGRRHPGLLAAVLQHPEWALNPRLTIGRSVTEPLRLVEDDKARQADRVAEMLNATGLDPDMAKRYPSELSGGQRQRAAVARALITAPRLIVFDEAVSALDVSIQSQILNLILDLQEKSGFAALFISHDIGAVRYVSRRVSVLEAGCLAETTAASELYQTPKNQLTKRLLQASGLIPNEEENP